MKHGTWFRDGTETATLIVGLDYPEVIFESRLFSDSVSGAVLCFLISK